ncbi:uncharacterized protein LOC132697013 isoform X2 [Cylas formicarius]|uniref:uncharacterized protein LOC132697013 isoform X2 n=1 Tax=Cylas formicarius TaxID=197179 RepID=UPI002958338B|nr:uncharacterized protein LOC132697013 isoform X2 [Cylas formicarius]
METEQPTFEINRLKHKVAQLEAALNSCEERASNLQAAVDLYLNSIEMLECVEQNTNEEFWLQSRDYDKLQELIVDLEIEHCDNLQTVQILEDQITKHKKLLKDKEKETCECKDQVKKLAKQKKCYEEVVAYFKDEIAVMAEQLNNLQELLTLSNESSQQESQKFMRAYAEIQELNENLSSQLCGCQQRAEHERRLNQLYETKISELQKNIQEKELDLCRHKDTIGNISEQLQSCLRQNQEFQATVFQLNTATIQLQRAVKTYEVENESIKQRSRECQERIESYSKLLGELKSNLQEKTTECLKFEKAYKNKKTALNAAQSELCECRKKMQENELNMVDVLNDLKEKLSISEDSNNRLFEEYGKLQAHLASVANKEAVKDQEIKRYRKIVGELKGTMMELNSELTKGLIQKELKENNCNNKKCKRNAEATSRREDSCNCPCEVEFYQKMVDILKKSITDLKAKLTDAQQKNKQLEESVKRKDTEIAELGKIQENKDKELNDCRNLITKLTAELHDARQNVSKLTDLTKKLEKEVSQLNQDLEVRTLQLNEDNRKAQEINSSKCVQLVCAQDEIQNLKEEMTNVLKRVDKLDKENKMLRTENNQFQCTITCLRDKSDRVQRQLDQYREEMQHVTAEKCELMQENKHLADQMKTLQSSYYCINSQQRELQGHKRPVRPIHKDKMDDSRTKRRTECVSPCSLGSQGIASAYEHESPSGSPCPNDVYDWYSSTFRSESENDSADEELCVTRLNNLTQEMRKSNRAWLHQSKTYGDYGVSRETK